MTLQQYGERNLRVNLASRGGGRGRSRGNERTRGNDATSGRGMFCRIIIRVHGIHKEGLVTWLTIKLQRGMP